MPVKTLSATKVEVVAERGAYLSATAPPIRRMRSPVCGRRVRWRKVGRVNSTKPHGDILPVRPDHLIGVDLVSPSILELQFADQRFALKTKTLGMPVNRIQWETAKPEPSGTGMTVTAVRGEQITIDATTLRYLVDPLYAAEIDAAAAKMRLSDDELKALALDSPPPAEWYDRPEDLRLESWK